MTLVYPDFLTDVQAWLKVHPDLAPLHGGRVFLRIPNKPEQVGVPFQRIYRVGGGQVPNTEVPQLNVRLSVESWGHTFGDYPAVRQLVLATESALHVMENETSGGTLMQYAYVSGSVDSPDPDTGWPRFVSDLQLTCRAAASISVKGS